MKLEKLTKFCKEALSSNSPVSSKRIAGFMGWLSSISIVYTLAFLEKPVPVSIETILWISAGLLGLDSVTSIFKKKE